jgi:hypothetical protein
MNTSVETDTRRTGLRARLLQFGAGAMVSFLTWTILQQQSLRPMASALVIPLRMVQADTQLARDLLSVAWTTAASVSATIASPLHIPAFCSWEGEPVSNDRLSCPENSGVESEDLVQTAGFGYP